MDETISISNKELCLIVLNMREDLEQTKNKLKQVEHKLEQAEHKLEKYKKYVDKEKKKINIIEHLNTNHTDVILFDVWLKKLAINDDQLDYMFEHGYVDGIDLYLQQNLPFTDVNSHPIRCFDQKRGIFYYMTKKGWIIMDQTAIVECIRIINSKFMRKYSIWRNEHKEKIDNNDRFFEKSVDYLKIVSGGNISEDKSVQKLKNKLYYYLKRDLKNIVQYEFVF